MDMWKENNITDKNDDPHEYYLESQIILLMLIGQTCDGIQIMYVYEYNGIEYCMRWKIGCSIQRG